MKILNEVNFVESVGADRWIGAGYKDAFEELGHEVLWLTSAHDFKLRLEEVNPGILFIGLERITAKTAPILLDARKRGTKVVVAVSSVFDPNSETIKIIKEQEVADLYRGETEKAWMTDFIEATERPYFVTANALNPKYHFPTTPDKKYECDIVFLGANLPLKKELFNELLFPLQKKYNVKLFGPGWTLRDKALRALAYSARRMKLSKLNDIISKQRITVPLEDENKLYSSAKISINIHERREGPTKNHVILNERTFKIPGCGGFEICDYIPPKEVLRRYFREDEVVYAENSKDWFDKIYHYLNHPEEREAIRQKGTKRALADHTYKHRALEILEALGIN